MVAKIFYKDKNNKDALISINQELSMTKKVGFSDESDLGKMLLLDKILSNFLKVLKA